jgi:hypothetical protein
MFIGASVVKNLAPSGATCAVVLAQKVALLRSADSRRGVEAKNVPPLTGRAVDANAVALPN